MQDGEGLYILIRPNGSKLWRYNYSFENKKYVYSFGKYPDISLEKARILHQEGIKLKIDGINPVEQKRKVKLEKKQKSVTTFKSITEEWLIKKIRESSVGYSKEIKSRIERNLYPLLGERDIREIKKSDVASAQKIIDIRSPELADRCLNYTQNIFEYAEYLGIIEFSVIASLSASKFLTKYGSTNYIL